MKLRLTSRPAAGRICLPCGLRAFTGTSRTPPGYPSPSPRRSNAPRWYRNVRLLCIGYASRPRLSSRLTLGGLASPRNPYSRRQGFLALVSLLMPAFSLPCGPPTVARRLRPGMESSPTTDKTVRCFGTSLSPVYCRRMSTRPVSCYALFK